MKTISERLWSKVTRGGDDECWPFAGNIRGGYGLITLSNPKRTEGAHRIAFSLVNGPIPYGLKVLHRCDNRPCCNPKHLFLGTSADNTRDMMQKGRSAFVGPGSFGPGAANIKAKLTIEQAAEVKRRRLSGERCRILAEEFGITAQLVSCIALGRAWKMIP